MADLVVFGENWSDLPSSTQQLVSRLLPNHRVIWINSFGMGNSKPQFRNIRQLLSRALIDNPTPIDDIRESDSLTIINPIVLPFHGLSFVRKINKQLLLRSIHQACQKHDFQNILLLTPFPATVDVVGQLGEKASIYYCGDNFDTLDSVDNTVVGSVEMELANKVDLILAANEQFAKKLPAPNTLVLPHGIDFEHFSNPQPHPGDFPREQPVAGFYGNLSEWLDVDMLSQAATALPGWQFVFVGPVKTDVGVLSELPNVHFLGPRPRSKLPAYVQNWDVALLPFQKHQQIEACNVLKLREYLAAGTAVASTDCPAVSSYSDCITIQSHREPFSRVIQRAYEGRNEKSTRQETGCQRILVVSSQST